GPPPAAVIAPIADAEFIRTVKDHARAWQGWIGDYAQRRKSQAYAILTMCRALYTCRHGEQVSKRQAALWAAEHYPAWAALVMQAWEWRMAGEDGEADSVVTVPELQAFVDFAVDQITAAST